MKNKKELLKTREEKLLELLGEMNSDSRPDDGRIICETEITMARVKAYSDFMYALKMKPWQTASYYAAAFFFC